MFKGERLWEEQNPFTSEFWKMSERWKKTWYRSNLFTSSAQRTIDPKFQILRFLWLIGQLEIWKLPRIWNYICFMKLSLITNTSAPPKNGEKGKKKNSLNTSWSKQEYFVQRSFFSSDLYLKGMLFPKGRQYSFTFVTLSWLQSSCMSITGSAGWLQVLKTHSSL